MAAIIGFVVLFAIFCFWMASRSSKRSKLLVEAAMRIISAQTLTFARRRAQLVYIDQYGVEKAEKWEKEKLYITSTVINSKLHADGFDSMPTKLLLQLIEHAARSVKLDNEVADIADVTTGIQYEKYCAEALLKAGWNARLTAATGDQGTDIVAERDGRRVIVQCKFYSSPVGNKAVQEAAAARLHERADQAIVVSNAEYTKSARQLAGTTGVILLHHDNLKNL